MEKRSCPFCEAELPTGATVCRLCGHDVDETNPWRRFWARANGVIRAQVKREEPARMSLSGTGQPGGQADAASQNLPLPRTTPEPTARCPNAPWGPTRRRNPRRGKRSAPNCAPATP